MATVGVAIGAMGVARFAADTVKMAVAAEEAGAAFETTFGPAVGKVQGFVDEWANTMGFANHELQQMLAISGAVAQGIGFTEEASADLAISMATLAGDVASFTNATGGAEAVLLALQSAINGEREALKTYGLAILETEVQQKALNMTGKETIKELTRQDKALATVALAYEKAGKMVGDLERTQDSAANQMRDLNAVWKEAQVAIGQALLPALEAMLPALKDLVPVFGDIIGAVAKALVPALKLLAPLLQGVADVLDVLDTKGLLVIGSVVALTKVWKFLTAEVALSTTTMKSFNITAIATKGALAGLAVLAGVALVEHQKSRQSVDELTESYKNLILEGGDWEAAMKNMTVEQRLQHKAMIEAGGDWERIANRAMRTAIELAEEYTDAVAEQALTQWNNNRRTAETGEALDKLARVQGNAANATEDWRDKTLDADHAGRSYAQHLQALGGQFEETPPKIEIMAGEMEGLRTTTNAAEGAFKSLMDTQARALDPMLNYFGALGDVEQASADMQAVMNDANATADESIVATLELEKANRLLILAAIDAKVKGEEVVEVWRQQVIDGEITKQKFIEMTERLIELGLVDPDILITHNAIEVSQAMKTLGERLTKLAGHYKVVIHTQHTSSGGPSTGFTTPSGAQGMHRGGPVDRGRPYIVGEKGPEIFIPKDPGEIMSNKDSFGGPAGMQSLRRGAANGQPINIHITGDPDPHKTAKAVRDELLRLQRHNRTTGIV
jgi:hypothetical protein